MQHWLTNAQIFTGTEWLSNAHVCVADDRIAAVTTEQPAADVPQHNCHGHRLLPALIDAQIYGGGSRLFAQYPDEESLSLLAAANRKGGTVACLATIPTFHMERILESAKAVKTYIANGGEGILGLHLEGPFIHVEKRGAHVAEWVTVPTVQQITEILEAADGYLKMITVAPECCSNEVLQMLQDAGVIISAGHSNASYAQAQQFSRRGVQTVTHLFNAMTPLHHRNPGIPLAVFEDENLMASVIPDGIHVNYGMIRMAKQLMGERLFFITDAVTDCYEGPYQHVLNDDHYALPNGTLSGSAISMLQAVRNGITHIGLTPDESIRMAGLYPARLLQITDDYGSIAVGKKAALIEVDDDWNLVKQYGY